MHEEANSVKRSDPGGEALQTPAEAAQARELALDLAATLIQATSERTRSSLKQVDRPQPMRAVPTMT